MNCDGSIPLGISRLRSDAPVVVLTGAGISEASGLPVYRSDEPDAGLWNHEKIERVATREALEASPGEVHGFANELRRRAAEAEPNEAHLWLSRLQEELSIQSVIVTQNVDGLHLRAGSPAEQVIEVHGSLFRKRCEGCGEIFDCLGQTSADEGCRHCGVEGTVRPDIVLFGEEPLGFDRIRALTARCQLFIAIGTSGEVEPVASLVKRARYKARAWTIAMAKEPPTNARRFHRLFCGSAEALVPRLVQRLLELPIDP